MEVKINEYPQLHMLCWNRPDNTVLDGRDALALYERNWRFVDQSALTNAEHCLLNTLVADYGHGVFMPA
ncbi:hypothetical protein KKF91_06600 [Myxococcota bacterium]|nr:hypothetical protein [Myxococcota bacterium]MBU1430224.1 hypothetical protein [Myxococcota bacterium]MBU1896720.1 hypothetical protein [Myxococcota bacterium]